MFFNAPNLQIGSTPGATLLLYACARYSHEVIIQTKRSLANWIKNMTITIKNDNDIAQMRVACRLASEVLDYITPSIAAGITTAELDRLCHEYMLNEQKTIPAPLNYQPPGYSPYPKATCISVNDVVCHGIPGDKTLKNGDILNIDITVIKNGYFGDTSRMFIVGEGSILAKRLVQTTYECMWRGIDQVRPGAQLGDVGYAIQQHAHAQGYSIVREYCGHGIGQTFHEEPQVLHYGQPGTGLKLTPGMIFTIEPMINAGRREIRTMPDGWTVKTRDRSLSAQWEHTVLVTETGHEVLTLSVGAPARPANSVAA
ncbi:type I methionyl aminopeptidase [Mycoavidus cysteinexigens]|nr:type I methionyl aminopeptidase [Mycoavidus cysteinexigens]GAM52327.1 methionine aminopeptidase [bacterium endosymbiont of Mortierella elongata FMR23-6]